MKTARTALFLMAFGVLAGCAPDPAMVCDHMMEVMKNDAEKPGYLSDDDKCESRMEKTKTRYGVNSYRREVECILGSTTAYKIRTCLEVEKKRRP